MAARADAAGADAAVVEAAGQLIQGWMQLGCMCPVVHECTQLGIHGWAYAAGVDATGTDTTWANVTGSDVAG